MVLEGERPWRDALEASKSGKAEACMADTEMRREDAPTVVVWGRSEVEPRGGGTRARRDERTGRGWCQADQHGRLRTSRKTRLGVDAVREVGVACAARVGDGHARGHGDVIGNGALDMHVAVAMACEPGKRAWPLDLQRREVS
jgi:hypothetical protein